MLSNLRMFAHIENHRLVKLDEIVCSLLNQRHFTATGSTAIERFRTGEWGITSIPPESRLWWFRCNALPCFFSVLHCCSFLEIFFESTIYFSCLVYLMGIHLWCFFDNVAIETRANYNSADHGLMLVMHEDRVCNRDHEPRKILFLAYFNVQPPSTSVLETKRKGTLGEFNTNVQIIRKHCNPENAYWLA